MRSWEATETLRRWVYVAWLKQIRTYLRFLVIAPMHSYSFPFLQQNIETGMIVILQPIQCSLHQFLSHRWLVTPPLGAHVSRQPTPSDLRFTPSSIQVLPKSTISVLGIRCMLDNVCELFFYRCIKSLWCKERITLVVKRDECTQLLRWKWWFGDRRGRSGTWRRRRRGCLCRCKPTYGSW